MPEHPKPDRPTRRLAKLFEAHGLSEALPRHLRNLDTCPCGEWLTHDDDWGVFCPRCEAVELVGTPCPE